MELVIDNSDFSKKGILESLHKYSEGIKEERYTQVCELVYTTMLNKVIDNSKHTFTFEKGGSDNLYIKIIMIELYARG